MTFVISKPALLCKQKVVDPEGPEEQEQPRIDGIFLARAPGSNAGIMQQWHQASYLECGVSVCTLQSQGCAQEHAFGLILHPSASLLGGHGTQWWIYVRQASRKAQTSLSQRSGHCLLTLWSISWVSGTYRCTSHAFLGWETTCA